MSAAGTGTPATHPCDGRGLVGVDCPDSLPARAAWVIPSDSDFAAQAGSKRYRWAVVVRCPRALQHAFTVRLPPVGSVVRVEQGRIHVLRSASQSAEELGRAVRAGAAR